MTGTNPPIPPVVPVWGRDIVYPDAGEDDAPDTLSRLAHVSRVHYAEERLRAEESGVSR